MALLTVTELREAITTSLTDDRVEELLDATEEDIIAAAGTTTVQTEHADGGHAALVLVRPINGSITSVTEKADTTGELVLSADDYRIDGYILHRLNTGTNPRWTWNGLVKVLHVPAARDAERKRAQVALVSLDLAAASGKTSERIGDYSVGYVGSTTYLEQRALILAGLAPLKVA